MSGPDPAAPFAVARSLALYLFSVGASACALSAFPLPSWTATVTLAVPGHALALVAGEALAGAVPEAERTWRARGRLLAAVAYASLLAVAVLVVSAVPTPAVIGRVATLLVLLQPAWLGLAGALGDARLALTNGLALVVVAALRGGPLAAAAALAAFVLLAAFLAAHNAAGVLGAYAARRGPGPVAVAREGVAVAGPVAALLAASLFAWPPRPWAGVQWTAAGVGELPARIYGLLMLLGIMGAGAVGLAAQLLRRRRRQAPPLEEVVEPLGADEEPLPPEEPPPDPPLRGGRGRVVGAYVSVLRLAARRGRPRRAHVTPLEFARVWPGLAGLPRLTELFMDARYGPDEPSPAAVAEAEGAADEARRALSARPGPGLSAR